MIEKIKNGDHSAFEEIIETYKAYVCAIILSIIGDAEDVQDIAQEVFLQVYRSLPGYKSGSFKSWMGRIAVNKSIDWKRAHSTANASYDSEGLDQVMDLSQAGSPEQFILYQEDREKMKFVCGLLPQRYAEVITKFYYQDMSYQEIATEEGISLKTVESRLYRARALLRERWEELEE